MSANNVDPETAKDIAADVEAIDDSTPRRGRKSGSQTQPPAVRQKKCPDCIDGLVDPFTPCLKCNRTGYIE